MVLDRRTCANIIVAAAPIIEIISSAVVTGRAVITIGPVVEIPVIVFVGWPGVQEIAYHQVLLSRLVIFAFRGGVVPFPRLVVIIVLVFQFPVQKELEILAIN
jgi:hypothetical protein